MFIIGNFTPIGGQGRAGNSPAHWSYQSATDNLATVQASNYFDEIGTQVSPGDFINVSLPDGKAIITVVSTTLTPPGVLIDPAVIGSGSGGGAGLLSTTIFTSVNLALTSIHDGNEIRVDTSSGDVAINLPDSASLTKDFRVSIVKTSMDGNDVFVDASGSDTINGDVSDTQSVPFDRKIYVLSQPNTTWVVDNHVPTLIPFVTPIGSSTTIGFDDNLFMFQVTGAGAFTVNVPDDATEAIPQGMQVDILRSGTGSVTFAPLGSAVIESRGGLLNINAQHSAATLIKLGVDTWLLIGDLA